MLLWIAAGRTDDRKLWYGLLCLVYYATICILCSVKFGDFHFYSENETFQEADIDPDELS